jgi:hypothetical protein
MVMAAVAVVQEEEQKDMKIFVEGFNSTQKCSINRVH